MTLDDVFGDLIEALSLSRDSAYLVNWSETHRWPKDTLGYFTATGLLHHAKRADVITCHHCDNQCTVNVHIWEEDDDNTYAHAVCIDTDMQEEMGILHFPIDQLRQWKITTLQLAKVIHRLLGIKTKLEHNSSQDFIKIGFIQGGEGRRALTLHTNPLRLEVNNHILQITDVCYFDHKDLVIDFAYIEACVNKPAKDKNPRYQKSNKRQQARKLETEARNKDIQEAYKKLRKKHPKSSLHTDDWFAKKIQEQGIGIDIKTSSVVRIMKDS